MLTLLFLYRRAPKFVRVLVLAVLLVVFVSTIVRVLKATHQIQEKNTNVHTSRSTQ